MLGTLLLAAILHVGPERAVSRPTPETAPYQQIVADVVAGGDSALAVWRDGYPWFPAMEIRAARIDRDGGRLDLQPLVLASGDGNRGAPAVSRGQGKWLVVWFEDPFIVGRFVGDDGSVGPTQRLAAPRSSNGFVVAASNGTHFLVAWQETPSGSFAEWRWVATRLDADGRVVNEQLPLDSHPVGYAGASLVASGTGFRLVLARWAGSRPDDPNGDAYAVEALTIDAAGAVVARKNIGGEPTTISSLTATVHDGRLLAGWTTGVFGDVQAHVAFEDEARRTVATGIVSLQDLVVIGGRAYAVIDDHDTVRLLPLDAGAGRTWEVGGGRLTAVRAVSLGGRALLLASIAPQWFTDPYGGEALFKTVIDAGLSDVTPAQLVAPEARLQVEPDIARRNDRQALVAWIENRGDRGTVVAATRVAADGTVVDAEPFIVAERVWPRQPRIASDGENYLVVWHSSAGVVTSRMIGADGTLAAAVEHEKGFAYEACVAWNGVDYLLAYIHPIAVSRLGATTEPRAIRIGRDGTAKDVLVLAPAQSGYYDIGCAAGREQTLFVWSGVRGALVSDGGTVSGPIAIGSGLYPAVASNGSTFLVAAQNEQGLHRYAVSEGGTVSPSNGAPLPPVFVTDTREPFSLTNVRDGFLLLTGTADIYAYSLSPDGTVLGDAFPLAATPFIERNAAVAGGGDALAVYMRATDASWAPRWRVFTRSIVTFPGRRRAVR